MFGLFRRRDAPEELIVGNRVFVLGLDSMVRAALARHEKAELLKCAVEVSKALGIAGQSGPVEGSYADDPDRARYFSLVRALQQEKLQREAEVAHMPEFRRLLAVTSSRIFGHADRDDCLLPMGRDALTQALESAPWRVADLTAAAAVAAERSEDISLVGVAARTRDSVALAATRESCVLYAKPAFIGVPNAFVYTWKVDPSVCAAAKHFVREFETLFGEGFPEPEARHAEAYFQACQANQIGGRCVRLGWRDGRHYHWAIAGNAADWRVQEFWDESLWTTEQYRASAR